MVSEQKKSNLIIIPEGTGRRRASLPVSSDQWQEVAWKSVAGWAAPSRFSVYWEPDGFLNTSATRPRLLLWTTHTLSVLSLHPTLWGTARLMFGLKAERQKMLCELWEQKQFSPWGRRSNAGVCSDGLRSFFCLCSVSFELLLLFTVSYSLYAVKKHITQRICDIEITLYKGGSQNSCRARL